MKKDGHRSASSLLAVFSFREKRTAEFRQRGATMTGVVATG